jgi:hypothetical protein
MESGFLAYPGRASFSFDLPINAVRLRCPDQAQTES